MTPRMWLTAVASVFLVVGTVAVADVTDANAPATLAGIIVACAVGGVLVAFSLEAD